MCEKSLTLTAVFAFVAFSAPPVFSDYTTCDGTIRCPSLDVTTNNNFLPHPTDCTKSYKCKNGKPTIYACPNGKLFTVDKQKCVDPSNAICNRRCIEQYPEITENITNSPETTTEMPICDGKIRCPASNYTTNNNFLPHPTDCTKSYKCKNGKPIIYTCPNGELFSVDEQKCVEPSRTTCKRRCIEPPVETTTVPDSSNSSEESSSETTEETSSNDCDSSEITECTTTSTETTTEASGNSCESTESHSSECSETCDCSGSSSEEATTETCDNNSDSSENHSTECNSSSSVEESTTTSSEITTETSGNNCDSSECSDSSESPEKYGCDVSKCLDINGNITIYLPHEDCTKFCVCNWGNVHIFDCPSPLHFNPKLNVCDWPYNAGCEHYNYI